jgi:hypothetical protein
MFIFISHNVLTEKESPHGYRLLCCLRAYLDLTMWEALEVHTEETIASGRKAVKRFGKLLSVSDFPWIPWKAISADLLIRPTQINLQGLELIKILTFQSSMLRLTYLTILNKKACFATIALDSLNDYMAH